MSGHNMQEVCDGMTCRYEIDVVRKRFSVTQGGAVVRINGEEIMRFGDKIELVKHDDGKSVWQSNVSDAEFIMATFFNKLDDVYHHSDKVKAVFERDISKAKTIRDELEIVFPVRDIR